MFRLPNNNIQAFSRRDFIKTGAVVSAAMLASGSRLFAAGSEKVKVALVGCGGRGKGALGDFLEAAKHLKLEVEIVALCDVQEEALSETAKKFVVAPERCFSDFLGYQKVLATDVEIVILATPPNFRPVHFEAAVKAGKHVFIEKPAAIDPPGVRKVLEAAKMATEKKLSIGCGVQRRNQRAYLETKAAIDQGAIGTILSANVWWCGGRLWYKQRQKDESDASYMIRNWINFTEMSGDQIVEQHIHNLDVANWFIGRTPQYAVGMGGRARRRTGTQFDFFSVDFDYGDGCHVHSMSRQVSGCYEAIREQFVGTEGVTYGTGPGKQGFAKKIDVPTFDVLDNPFVQEHVDLLKSIRGDGPYENLAPQMAEATMTAIMGRIRAYTGLLIRWTDLMVNNQSPWYNLTLKPTALDFEMGPVVAPKDDMIPVPGRA